MSETANPAPSTAEPAAPTTNVAPSSPLGVVYYAVVNPTNGQITGAGHMPAAAATPDRMAQLKATIITQQQYALLYRTRDKYTLIAGQLTLLTADPAGSLTSLRQSASAKVDAAAEAARNAVITPGSGQVMEYAATLADAQAITAAPDPLDAALYPWAAAELSALQAAGNATATLRSVAAAALSQHAAWVAYGPVIKQTRRAAKLAIAAAATVTGIKSVVTSLRFPTPAVTASVAPAAPATKPAG